MAECTGPPRAPGAGGRGGWVIRVELGRAVGDRIWDSRLREETNCPKEGGRVRGKVDKILPF